MIPKIIHAGLRLFFGGPVADDAVRPGVSPAHVIIVGVGFLAFGAFLIVSDDGSESIPHASGVISVAGRES
nr:hypothetical protein [Microbacterium hydrocarbonoxydans]